MQSCNGKGNGNDGSDVLTNDKLIGVNSVNNVNVKDMKKNVNGNVDNMYLWHKRLGHLHMNGMNMLLNKEMVIGYSDLASIKHQTQHIQSQVQSPSQS